MQYWLMKSEEEDYSITDLKKDKVTPWIGVRNFQARNFMRDSMHIGDLVLFYHSNGTPSGVAGIGKVGSKPYPDKTQWDKKSKYYDKRATKEKPLWFLVDVSFVDISKKIISLEKMRTIKELSSMTILQRGNRLSITPVTRKEFSTILRLSKE
jgi:predicted RNA-binding protein with PUA-like domain